MVDHLAVPLVRTGYRYARSGPHATRRRTHISSKVYFSSSHLNVAGELVVLHISLQVLDAQLGTWRRDQPTPRRTDDVVATWHLGHLLDPPRWLEWNLASARDRSATIADIETTLHDAGLEFIDVLVEDLLGAADPSTLAGRVDIEALIEYYVRAGRRDETPALIDAALSRFHEQGRVHFVERVLRWRNEGLPRQQLVGAPNSLAFLVVQFDLPVDLV